MNHAFLVVTNSLPHLTIANFEIMFLLFLVQVQVLHVGEDERKGKGKRRGKKPGEDNNDPM